MQQELHTIDSQAQRVLGQHAAKEHVIDHEDERGWHPKWIAPDTSETKYLTGTSSLTLTSPELGEAAGGTNPAAWFAPVDGVPAHAHMAMDSTHDYYVQGCKDFRAVFGDAELADARPALVRQGHPASKRAETIWCATHVRAVIEDAWNLCLDLVESGQEERLLKLRTPRKVAKYFGTSEEWRRFHDMAEQLGREKARSERMREVWEDWRIRQCPLADFHRPDARWQG